MSLCRIIIRLEIADSCERFINLRFNADPTDDSNVGGSVGLSKEQAALYRGRRQYYDITVEHYTPMEDTEHCSAVSADLDADQGSSLTEPDAKSADNARPGSGTMWSKAATSLKFFCGNPSVETTEGIVHLYREDQLSTAQNSSMICMLKVPATFTSQDLLQFIAPVEPLLEHIKIIRDATPNQYMVLLKFKNETQANEFYQTYNNQPFNSIEPEICHLAFVSRLESMLSSEGAGLQMAGGTELPNCTVCLERMDESVKGILTILCNHSFHVACLAEWKDTSCPVCRYVQVPVPTTDNKCFKCSAQVNLWICLICGFVGCGRYVEGHAYNHFKDTSHTYSMELGTNRVWDYAGDNYVHRLVQNKADGKLVEVDEQSNNVQEEKIDGLNLEFTYLLTSQLESQRLYFEETMQNLERQSQRQVEELEAKAKKVMEEMTRVEHHSEHALKEVKRLTDHAGKLDQQVAAVSKEKQKVCAKLTKELEEERTMNRCLRENQTKWQERVSDLETKLARKDAEVAELQDQLRDVMFFLEAKNTLATTGEATQQEIQEGQIIVQTAGNAESGAAGNTPAGKKSRNRKR